MDKQNSQLDKLICPDCGGDMKEIKRELYCCYGCGMKAQQISIEEIVTPGGIKMLNDDAEIESISDQGISYVSKFRWKDRLSLIEILALEYADNGGKFDAALKSVRVSEFAYYASKMPVKQKTQLKRDVISRSKDISHMRDAANVGDVVRVPNYKENTLLGGYIRVGIKLVEAVITHKERFSSSYRYTFKRTADGQIQKGNGHMIKEIVSRGKVHISQ